MVSSKISHGPDETIRDNLTPTVFGTRVQPLQISYQSFFLLFAFYFCLAANISFIRSPPLFSPPSERSWHPCSFSTPSVFPLWATSLYSHYAITMLTETWRSSCSLLAERTSRMLRVFLFDSILPRFLFFHFSIAPLFLVFPCPFCFHCLGFLLLLPILLSSPLLLFPLFSFARIFLFFSSSRSHHPPPLLSALT